MRYSEWILGAPTLEAGIACSAMAQDEWGHSRILYAMLKDFGHDPNALEHEREANAYVTSELLDAPPDTWPELLVLNALLDTALSSAVPRHGRQPLRPAPLQDGQAHRRRALPPRARPGMGRAPGGDRRRQTRVGPQTSSRPSRAACAGSAARTPTCGTGSWRNPLSTEDPTSCAPGGSTGSATCWISRASIGRPTRPATVSTGADWDDERRRAGAGGPDAETLARVRG